MTCRNGGRAQRLHGCTHARTKDCRGIKVAGQGAAAAGRTDSISELASMRAGSEISPWTGRTRAAPLDSSSPPPSAVVLLLFPLPRPRDRSKLPCRRDQRRESTSKATNTKAIGPLKRPVATALYFGSSCLASQHQKRGSRGGALDLGRRAASARDTTGARELA